MPRGRYEGIRTTDFAHVLTELIEQLDTQSGPVEARPANVTFTKWVKLAGGRVRGTKLEIEEGMLPPKPQFSEIWPLHLLDVADDSQMQLLRELLARLPPLLEHYLSSFVFPQTMLHQTVKLSANAQELGGDLLFKTRLGFSGTPSDLLPLELGHCHYAEGDDAKILHILTSPVNVSYLPLPIDWSVVGLLQSIATAQPPYNALIDTGALVTGLSNLQVAQALLHYGLPDVDAVVFLDEHDRKMTLLRKGGKVVALNECGVALERRFSFYDQVHTTGMDIEQLLNAHAALTLGKDMVFRDYAQGAFRLRKIGQGQRLTLHVIPEVMTLIGAFMARQRGESVATYSAHFTKLSPHEQWSEMLRAVVGWLLSNSVAYERTQFKLLCEQNLAAVWRKRAYRNLLAGWEHLLPHSSTGGLQGMIFGADKRRSDCSEELKPSIVVFREGVDFSVENTVPAVFDYVQKLTQRVADTHELCEGDEEAAAVSSIMKLVVDADFGADPRAKQRAAALGGGGGGGGKARVLFSFSPLQQGDLTLAEGDEVSILTRGDDGWWMGEVRGKRGRFPGSYVDDPNGGTGGGGTGGMWVEPGEGDDLGLSTEQVQEQEQEQEQEEEQQKEQQVEQEQASMSEAPEEAARQKYARDHEAPSPWPTASLEAPPNDEIGGGSPFHGWSAFRVYNPSGGGDNGAPAALGMRFPPSVCLSSNFYHSGLHASKPRRIKNLIMALEWCPDGRPSAHPGDGGASPRVAPAALAPVALEQLQGVYGTCAGGDGRGMPLTQVWQLWRSMEVRVDDPHETARLHAVLAANGISAHEEYATVNFEQLCALMHPSALQAEPTGRYFVTVSLVEAESLRALLHQREEQPLSPNGGLCTAALHMLGCGESTAVLDASYGHELMGTSHAGALGTVVQCLRFIDCQMEYTLPQQTLLLRAVQENGSLMRQSFFAAVCASRRRMQHGWATRSIAKVFALEHELCNLRQISVMMRIRMLLAQRGLYLLDAFRAFNASQNGMLTCSELYGALVWLGLRVTPPDVHAMVRYMDKDGDGLVSYDEFRLAVGVAGVAEEEEWSEAAGMVDGGRGAVGEFSGLTPIAVPEIAEVDDAEAAEAHASGGARAGRVEVPTAVLDQIKLKVKKLDKFDEVWRSSGIATKQKASVWEDRLSASRKLVQGRNRMRVCLGHFASSSYAAPRAERYTLELTDLTINAVQQSKWLPLAARQCLVHPQRFHRVWGVQTGSQPLFVWEPIPPNDSFVALGMVATSTEEAPPIRSVHCVPSDWVEPAPELTKLLWQDAGSSGKPGSLWAIGSLSLLAATQGNASPSGKSWQLKRSRFTLGEFLPGMGMAAGEVRQSRLLRTMGDDDADREPREPPELA